MNKFNNSHLYLFSLVFLILGALILDSGFFYTTGAVITSIGGIAGCGAVTNTLTKEK